MNIRRTIKGIICSAATLLLLFGCAKENPDIPSRTDGKARINFSAPIITEEAVTPQMTLQAASDKQTATRAIPLSANTTIRVVAFTKVNPTYKGDQAYFVDSDGKLKPCTVNDDGSFKAVDTQNELALYPDIYDFYAYTPALPLSASKNSVTVANGIDFASSVTPNVSVSNDMTQTLTNLDRKCSKIKLVVKKGDDNTLMTVLSVAAGGVTINNLPPAIATTGLNPSIPQASGTVTLNVPQSVFTTVNATETSAITYLLPRLGTNRMKIDYNLSYTVSGNSETKSISGSMGNTALEPGKSYTFTLTMRQSGASLAVTEWIDGGSQDVVAGESLDYTDNGKGWFYIASKDAVNPNNGTTTTMNWYIANGITDPTNNPNGKNACPTGWRVPTRDEIAMQWVYSKTITFDNAAYYWSNTSSSDLTQAWMGYFFNGVIIENIYKNAELKVRCIRDNGMAGLSYPRIDTDKQTIISRDATGGVKEAAILTSTQTTWLNTTNTSTTVYNEQSDYNKVPSNLQVALVDCNTTNSSMASDGTNGYTWESAYTACKAYSESGAGAGSWRVPTQRELLLVYLFSNKLQKPLTLGSVVAYWSGTESSGASDKACYLLYANKTLSGYLNPKGIHSYVRCVRDVQ